MSWQQQSQQTGGQVGQHNQDTHHRRDLPRSSQHHHRQPQLPQHDSLLLRNRYWLLADENGEPVIRN